MQTLSIYCQLPYKRRARQATIEGRQTLEIVSARNRRHRGNVMNDK